MVLDDDGDADAPFCASIFDGGEDPARIGIVTSGGWSFTLSESVALGYIRPEFAAAGTKVQIKIFGELKWATVGAEPLYDPHNERLRA
jgi:dimethylglycine dehydrogenase